MSDSQSGVISRRLPALLAAVGALLSGWLEYVHWTAHTAPSAKSFCSAGPKLDCATVALSRWSVVLGVPVPLWGVAAFMALTLLAWWRSRWLLPLSAAAALASIVLIGIELVAIHSVCLVCEAVHLTSFALFYLVWRDRRSLVDVEGITLAHIFTVPIGILVSARVLMTPYWAAFTWQGGVHLPHGTEADGSYWIGAEDPKLVVHEYTDYGCAHCAVATAALRRVLAEHASSLRVVHHNYPRMRCQTIGGDYACQYARAANCAGDQGKFWEMDSWLFDHAPGKATIDFGEAARELPLDGQKLSACMKGTTSYDRADAEALAAIRAQVIDAPSYLIDGKKYVGGEVFRELRRRL